MRAGNFESEGGSAITAVGTGCKASATVECKAATIRNVATRKVISLFDEGAGSATTLADCRQRMAASATEFQLPTGNRENRALRVSSLHFERVDGERRW
jgi:hypothetical protein